MTPKSKRLLRKNVEELFKLGKTKSSPNLIFRFIKTGTNGESKISFVVPKKFSKTATRRNFLRRRGYVALERQSPFIPKGVNGIFLFGKESERIFGIRGKNKIKSLEKLEEEIKSILEQLK